MVSRALLTLALLLLTPALTQAATVRDLDAGPYPGTPEEAAVRFLAEQGEEMELLDRDGAALVPSRTEPWRGRHFVHLQQEHSGVQVMGGAVVVKLDRDGTVGLATSTVVADLTVEPTPSIPAAAAQARATDAVIGVHAVTGTPELWVRPTNDGGRLVHVVPVFTDMPLAGWWVTVDAHSGAVVDVAERRRAAEGNVYEENPTTTPDPAQVTLTDLLGDESVMNGTYALVRSTVFDGQTAMSEHLAVADQDGNFLFEPDASAADDPFVEVHVYHHVTQACRWFEDVHGHTFDGPIHITTNYREEAGGSYNNAYMSYDQLGNTILVFGQGYVDFGYDADVVVHELGHSIIYDTTSFMSDFLPYDEYGRNDAPGAIHEGIADYWAGTFFDSAVVGEYYGGRDLENDNHCPADLYGEVHEDGKIVGGAMWDVRENLGPEAADEVVYGMLQGLSPSPSFAEVALLALELGADMVADGDVAQADLDAARAALDERGITQCGRSIPVVLDEPTEYSAMHFFGMPELPGQFCDMARESGITFPLGTQFAFTVPEESEGIVEEIDIQIGMLRVDGQVLGANDLLYSWYLRKDELVTLKYTDIPTEMGMDVPSPEGDEFDVVFAGEPTEIHLPGDGEGEVALEPGATYYLAMVHANCPSTDITVTVSATLGDPPGDDDDAADDDDDDDDDGCSCRADGRTGAPAAAALLAGVLALILRRRG